MERTAIQKSQFEAGMRMEVRNAQLAMLNARATLDQSKRALDITQRIYDKTNIKFKEGVGSSVEVTQAEGQLFEAQGIFPAGDDDGAAIELQHGPGLAVTLRHGCSPDLEPRTLWEGL